MTARPDIDTAAEWLAHKRAERVGFVLDIAALFGAGAVALAVLLGVLFAVAEAMR